MTRGRETISHSLVINASAETLYDMVADVTRMGAWVQGGAKQGVAEWRYRFTPTDLGTEVTEFLDTSPPLSRRPCE